MKWIDVNDRLPTRMQDVLVFTGIGYAVAHYEPGAGRWLDEDDREIDVMQWASLPAPPAPKKSRKPEYRNCRDCDYWKSGGNSDGTITRVCDFPRSPNFAEHTTADDGCTPSKKAREGWL